SLFMAMVNGRVHQHSTAINKGITAAGEGKAIAAIMVVNTATIKKKMKGVDDLEYSGLTSSLFTFDTPITYPSDYMF
ncbi:MAG: hypothetical protein QXS01_04550, partial [Candidatus Bathyarchaeia archaeon]